MTKLRCCSCLLLMMFSGFAFGQDTGGWRLYRPNQEVRVPQLPALTARSHDPSDVLLAALGIVFNDPSICCGRDSALEDRALAADPSSLKEIASKVEGKQLLSDGRPIMITADFVPSAPSDRHLPADRGPAEGKACPADGVELSSLCPLWGCLRRSRGRHRRQPVHDSQASAPGYAVFRLAAGGYFQSRYRRPKHRQRILVRGCETAVGLYFRLVSSHKCSHALKLALRG